MKPVQTPSFRNSKASPAYQSGGLQMIWEFERPGFMCFFAAGVEGLRAGFRATTGCLNLVTIYSAFGPHTTAIDDYR